MAQRRKFQEQEMSDDRKSGLVGTTEAAQVVQQPLTSGGRVRSYAIVTALMMGICFGLALEKGRVFEPSAIVDQFLLRRFIVTPPFPHSDWT